MPPFWKKKKDANKARELTILSKNYENPKDLEIEIYNDLTDETTKIILSEVCIDPDLITGVRNTPEPPDSPFSKYESEVRGENGKTYRLMFAEEQVLEKGRARWQEEKKSILKGIENLERAGRYEDAARYYEAYAEDFKDETLYDNARELRDRARGSQVKVTSIDVNELIKQLKESGGVIAYRCPTCSADLKVNGDTKSLGKCEYCGSKIENLPDVLKAILH
jgi:hypothetical protein